MEEIVKNEINDDAEGNQEEKQQFDYRKTREERLKRKFEKSLLDETGTSSLDEIKEKIQSIDSYQKQIDKLQNEVNESKINGYKVEVLKNGFDERFVEYIVYELKNKVSKDGDFSKLLKEFKEKNSQFLRNANQIKYSTAPNFETSSKVKDSHARMNDFFSGRSNTI